MDYYVKYSNLELEVWFRKSIMLMYAMPYRNTLNNTKFILAALCLIKTCNIYLLALFANSFFAHKCIYGFSFLKIPLLSVERHQFCKLKYCDLDPDQLCCTKALALLSSSCQIYNNVSAHWTWSVCKSGVFEERKN